MNFAMKIYWVFLIVVVIGVWSLPVRFRKSWLLIASYVSYGLWSVPYLGLMVAAAALNHFGAKWIVAGDRDRRGKVVIAANLLLLGVFKYLGFVCGIFTSAASWFGVQLALPIPKWALPLGISFYLFESISYIVDVMRKREKIHSFWDFQLFIAFFPKLVSGPILRAKEFLPQVERPLSLSATDVRLALREIVIGLFMKLLIADSVAKMVDRVYSRPITMATWIDAWLMAIAFGLQVYLDFSAYTRMAIGSAKLCGIDLVPNFDNPFISTSPSEFWQRWHMSLSRWIRDYLFFPMTQRAGAVKGSPTRVKVVKQLILMRAAFLSMVIFGIWHGASWNFVGYGVYHGALLAGYHLLTFRLSDVRPRKVEPKGVFGSVRASFMTFVSWAATFAVVSLGFLIFRAASIKDGLVLMGRALRPFAYPGRSVPDFMMFRTLGLAFAVLLFGHFARRQQLRKPTPTARKTDDASAANTANADRRVPEAGYLTFAAEGVGLGILFVLALLELTGRNSTFVYFQF